MGTTSSKDATDSRSISSNSFRKLSKSPKLSKIDELQKKLDVIQNVQTEIDLFGGDRRSPRYSQIQETLTSISKDFQDAKTATTKQKTRNKYEQALTEVQKSLQRLETRVSFNEQHLDAAAIESHSFINHTFTTPAPAPAPAETPPPSSQRTVSPPLLQKLDYEHAQNLDRLEHETHKLEQDVKLSIQLDDTKQLTFLEKKIQILYTDLEMIIIDSNNPLSETKATIGKRLIKCNNQIKKYKRISVHGKQNALARIERKLEYLEIQALTFTGVKNDEKYKEIKQNLENYLNDANQINEQEISERIKNTLKELANRADENHGQFEAMEKIKLLEDTVKILNEKVVQYRGLTSDPAYIQLDQELRNVWANTAEIEESNEDTQKNKTKLINMIQNALRSLNDNAKSTENQDLAKIKEFHNFWNQLNYDLDVQKINPDDSKSITETLKKISEEIGRKTNALEKIDRRKSTGNLVVTKMIHLEDVSKSQTSLTEGPMKTEIKVQPTLTIISEVQRIESELKSLCQEIRQTSFPENSAHYRKYKQRLDQLNQVLMKIDGNRNGTIDSNKKRAIKCLKDGYQALEEKNVKPVRTSKVVEVMDVHTEIQYFRQQIKTFKGVTKDHSYEKIKQGLSNCLTTLQVIDQEHAMKQDIIRQIQQYHQELETKLAENQAKVKVNEKTVETKRQVSQETKNVIEQVQKLKSQVERFSGVYEGLQFKQIQDELSVCNKKLENIDTMGDDRLESAKIQTKQKIRKYLKVLDEKSTKNEIVPEKRMSANLDAPHRRINSIRDQLMEIKIKTEQFGGRYKDSQYTEIEKQLLRCLEELRLVEDLGHKSVTTSKEQYEDYIVKLLTYFEEKAKLNETESEPKSEEAFQIADPTQALNLIENNIVKFRSKIETSNDDFTDLVNEEASLRNELEQIEVGNVAHIRDIKKKLLDNLQGCSSKLEENVSILKKINDINENVTEIYKLVRQFTGTKNDDQYNYLDENLIHLMVELDSVNCSKNGTLNIAKGDVRKLIEKAMKRLSERSKLVPILI